jgi:hypothetical protein
LNPDGDSSNIGEMSGDEVLPEFLSPGSPAIAASQQDQKRDELPVISQTELWQAEQIEITMAESRARIAGKLLKGATVEPGVWTLDASAIQLPIPRIAKRRENELFPKVPAFDSSESPMATPATRAEEADPDGGLTYSEQAMLRNFAVRGNYQPAVVRSIVDRFARLRGNRFAAERERMWRTGCFEMSDWMHRVVLFEVHLWRVRIAIRLFELGFGRFRGCILEGIYALNRAYFSLSRV